MTVVPAEVKRVQDLEELDTLDIDTNFVAQNGSGRLKRVPYSAIAGAPATLTQALLYDSQAFAEASEIPLAISAIETAGGAEPGNGGNATYKVAPSAQTGGFTSADGRHWEVADFTVTPEMFGAEGGDANDTAAVQTAFDVVREHGSGRVLLQQPYRTQSPIACYGDNMLVEWLGGAALVLDHTGNGLVCGRTAIAGANPLSTGLILRNPRILQNATPTAGIGLRILNYVEILAEQIDISAVPNPIVVGEQVADSVRELTVRGGSVSTGLSHAVRVDSGAILKFLDLKLDGSNTAGMAAFYLASAAYNVDGIEIGGITSERFSRGIDWSRKGGANGWFYNSIYDRTLEVGVYLVPTVSPLRMVNIEGLELSASSPSSTNNTGYILDGSAVSDGSRKGLHDVTISGGRTYDYGNGGIAANDTELLTVIGVTMRDLGGLGGGQRAGMRFSSCVGVSARGNNIDAASTDYGIRWLGANTGMDTAQLGDQNTIFGAAIAPVFNG